MVRKRPMMPFWRSVLRRNAAYAMPPITVMTDDPGAMKSTYSIEPVRSPSAPPNR
jgi:hypothetical protein